MTSQAAFRACLLDASLPVPDSLQDGLQRPAGKRFNIYRNNVVHSLIAAMNTAFPLVQKLIGPQNFENLAQLFVRAHPPSSPLMMFYGAAFPGFLETFAPLAHIRYLPDAARLDLALRASYHAADSPALTPRDIHDMQTDALAQARFVLAPATRIIQSRWPLFDIWRFNAADDAPKPRPVAQDVLITRESFDPAPHLLPAGAAHWLETLNAGEPFENAHAATQDAHPEFDLASALTLTLSTGALTDPSRRN